MKVITIFFLVISTLSFSQEAIFNVNANNLHLVNYSALNTELYSIRLDNSFEQYNTSKMYSEKRTFNTSRLNVLYRINRSLFTGAEVCYEYKNGINNIKSIDGIIGYRNSFSWGKSIAASVNFGYSNMQFNSTKIYNRYTYDLSITSQKIEKKKLNLGFSAIYNSRRLWAGASMNGISNSPNPENERIPVKYNAFIF